MTVCHLWYNGSVITADVSTMQEDAKRYKSNDGNTNAQEVEIKASNLFAN